MFDWNMKNMGLCLYKKNKIKKITKADNYQFGGLKLVQKSVLMIFEWFFPEIETIWQEPDKFSLICLGSKYSFYYFFLKWHGYKRAGEGGRIAANIGIDKHNIG